MGRAAVAITSIFALLCNFHTVKADDEGSSILSSMETFGYKVDRKITANACDVTMSLELSKVLDNFETLQKFGIFNSEMPKSSTREKPNTIAMAFIMQAMPLVTKKIYEENPGADRCSFTQKLSVLDDYGNDKVFTAFDYKFNRGLYKRINWDRFEPINMMKVFPSFHESVEMGHRVMDEVRRE